MNNRAVDASTPATRRRKPADRAGALRRPRGERRLWRLAGGGTDGNRQLTAVTGTILLILLAVIGVTIVRIGQLISEHLFVGLLLIGPVALKLASTGYRFTRYYTHDSAYRRAGPPVTVLRLIAPMIVLSTLVVFISGLILLFQGPGDRGQLVLIHKVSFIVWVVFTSLHVLGHLPAMPASLRAVRRANPDLPGAQPGAAGRWIAVSGALVAGLVLAIVLIPDFAAWTAHGAAFQHHHH
jgi:hypothetical protein